MKRSLISSAALACVLAFGCDDKKTDAPTPPSTPTAPKAETTVGGMMDKAKEAGAGAMDKAKEMAPDMTAAVQGIYDKAKAAIDGGKMDEAKGYVEQLKPYLDKVGPEWKAKIEDLIKQYTAKAAGLVPKM